jgi:hypothetical protein
MNRHPSRADATSASDPLRWIDRESERPHFT